MAIDANNNKLLSEYLEIFLNVSKKLQHVKVTQKEQDDLLKEISSQLGIIYGYFVELEPNQNHIIYFIEGGEATSKQGATSFEPPIIEYFSKSSGKNEPLYQALLKSEKEFDTFLKSPKLFQHLPIQVKSENPFKLISDDYLNCFIPNKIKNENDYYVVLFDEIVFFQFAYCYKVEKSLSEFYKDRKELILTYLLKFALSVEHKLGFDALHKELGVLKKRNNWNEKDEIEKGGIRADIKEIVDKNISNETWHEKINEHIKNIVDRLLKLFVENSIYQEIPEKYREKEILKHIARFDIEASFEISDDEKPIFHDMFVFPLYTETQTVYPTKCIDPKFELDIHSPILLVLYIKTLFEISNQQELDENELSIKGFHLTKEISKLFAERIIQGEYLKNVIKKQTVLQATKSAISQYMYRNLSHNLGSHSIPQFNLKLNQMIDKKDYWRSDELYQIRGYNEYIQGRMEFLAEFSSNAFSELYIEHSFKTLIEKLYFSMSKNESKPESGEFQIVFKGMVDSFVSDNVTVKLLGKPNGDEFVDIRGDNLGMQAFYIIVENVIRNLYKHSNKVVDEDGKSLILFDIKIHNWIADKELAADYYAIEIVDRHGKVNEEKWKDNDSADNAIQHINKLIWQKILKPDDNTLREEGWGLLEMKSAAAYLSGLPDYAIDTKYELFLDSNNKDVEHYKMDGITYPYPLKAFRYPDKESERNIAYRFYLPKTKFCLIDLPAPANELELKELGIEFGNKNGGRHKFFISDNETLITDFINQRSIKLAGLKELIGNLSKNTIDKFKERVWAKYLERYPELKSKEIFYATDSSPKTVAVPQQAITFDIHNKNITLNGKNSNDFEIDYLLPNGKPPLFYYYESFPSKSKLPSDVNPLEEPYCSMLKEAAVVKVSIFDERIQANSFEIDSQSENEKDTENFKTKLRKRDILLTSGVYVPPIEIIDLLEMAKSPNEESKQNFLNHFIEQIEYSDYLIVHFTLLEVYIGKTGKDEIEKWLKGFISDHKLNERNKALVLISGRGKPSNLPKGFYFANYTMIADCVGKYRSKLRLVTILKSLRK